MTNKTLTISFVEYDAPEQMSPADQELISKAIAATSTSYSPYSHFKVGAAVRLENDTIVSGSNQENIAYPSGLCAERTAMFYASAQYPGIAMKTIAIAAVQNGALLSDPATPCGSCRQVMAEYQTRSGKPLEVILVGSNHIWKFPDIDSLLPFIFDSLEF